MLHCAVITLEISRWNNCHSATRIKKTLTTTDLETHLICAQGSQFENLSQNTLDMPYDTTQGLCRTCPVRGRIGRTREASYEWLEHQRKCSQYYAHKHTHMCIIYRCMYHKVSNRYSYVPRGNGLAFTLSIPGTQEGTQDEQRSGLSQAWKGLTTGCCHWGMIFGFSLGFPCFPFPVIFVPAKSQEPVVSLLDQTTAESSWHHWT